MKVVGLISGGKDSCFNMMHCVANGHEIAALANLHPGPSAGDEIDSWMYQTVGHDVIQLYEEAMGLPLYRQTIDGSNIETELRYAGSAGDETEDLYRLLSKVKAELPDIEGVSVGAIASNYQRLRVENVASRLGLTVLAYLWERDQTELLREMIDAGVLAILIKVACVGLNEKHLGSTLAEIEPRMASLHSKFEVHPCGEGGEYETIVLDCPLFVKRFQIVDQEVVKLEGDTAYLKLKANVEPRLADDNKWKESILRAANLEDEYQSQLALLRPLECKTNHDNDRTNDLPGPLLSSMADLTTSSGQLISRRYVVRKSSSLGSISQLVPSDTSKILFCCLILKDMADFPAINAEYGKLWTAAHPPSRVCIATLIPDHVRLVLYTIELASGAPHITADEDAPVLPDRRLWVQSRSYWAPSNIGPYSQATTSNGLAFVSGQIGLIPNSMIMAQTFEEELMWSAQSLLRIVRNQGFEAWDLKVVCYILNLETAASPVRRTHEAVFDGLNSDLIVVELLSGSQMPRQAQVEWQLIASDPRSRFRLSVSNSQDPLALNIGFSTKDNIGFWTMPVKKIWFQGKPYDSLAISIRQLTSESHASRSDEE